MNQLTISPHSKFDEEYLPNRSRLLLYYQPIVCFRSGEVVGLEGLMRLIDHRKGLCLPSDFLDVLSAKVSSLLLFDWLLHQSHNHNNYFSSYGIHLPISINVRADEFENPCFLDLVNKFFTKTESKNFRLTFEISEVSKIKSVESIIDTIYELRNHDIRVSLDDFGTGFSNIDLIKKIPFDSVKIDKSLVFDMLKSDEDLALIQSIIRFLNSNGMEVVSEGVNSIEEAEILLESGCNIIQGFGISKAMKHQNIPFWIDKCCVEGDWWKKNAKTSPKLGNH